MGNGKSLQEMLKEPEDDRPETEAEAAADAPVIEPVARKGILDEIEGIEIEAVVGGALQRIRFKAGSDPSQVAVLLRLLDPKAEVRSEFPRKSFGSRETKLARALVINVEVKDSGKYINIVCQNGDDLTVSVKKKNADAFLDDLRAVGRLSEAHLDKVAKAFAEKGKMTIVLPEEERFGVNYTTWDDGSHYVDSFQADGPTSESGEGKGHE